jgi:hypothetical protein
VPELTAATKRRRLWLSVSLGLAWLTALIVVVAYTVATRSDLAGTNDSAGTALVVATAPAIAVAIWILRTPVVTIVAVVLGAFVTCALATSILNDESSTAAVGLIVVPVVSVVVVGIGVGFEVMAERREEPS